MIADYLKTNLSIKFLSQGQLEDSKDYQKVSFSIMTDSYSYRSISLPISSKSILNKIESGSALQNNHLNFNLLNLSEFEGFETKNCEKNSNHSRRKKELSALQVVSFPAISPAGRSPGGFYFQTEDGGRSNA